MLQLYSSFIGHWQILLLLILIICTRFAFKYVSYYRISRKWGTKPCKRASQSIYSRMRKIKEASKNGRLFQYHETQFLEEQADTIQTGFLGKNIIITKNPENVKWMLAKNCQDWNLGPRLGAFRPLLGHGIFVSDGSWWESSRQLLKPQFSREQISHVRMLEPHVRKLAQHIRESNGKSFDIQPLFHKLTMDAASEFLFGESVNSLDFDLAKSDLVISRKKKEFDLAMTFILTYLIKRVNALGFSWLHNSAEFKRRVKVVHDFTNTFIDKAMEKAADPASEKQTKYVLLSELLGHTSDRKILRDEMLNIMLAGRDTTASLLSSLLYELSRNPAVWAKLKDEIKQNFGSGDSAEEIESISFENLARCVYLRYVVNETLRMHPPVPQNARGAIRDTILPRGGGSDGQLPIFIEKSTIVAFQIQSMHRLPEFGEDAHVFRPERWADLSQVKSAFLPFGSGPRVCLGQKYALTEASYIVVRLAQMFPHLAPTGPDTYPPLVKSTSVMMYSDGVNVSMKEEM